MRLNRRHFFSRTSLGLGSMALASLLGEGGRAGEAAGADVSRRNAQAIDPAYRGVLAAPHFRPRRSGSSICS